MCLSLALFLSRSLSLAHSVCVAFSPASTTFGDELHTATKAIGELVPGDQLAAAASSDVNQDGLLDRSEFHQLVMSATQRPCGGVLFLGRRAFHEAVMLTPLVIGFICSLTAILGGSQALPLMHQMEWAGVASLYVAMSITRLVFVQRAHNSTVVALGLDRIIWLLATALLLLSYGQYVLAHANMVRATFTKQLGMLFVAYVVSDFYYQHVFLWLLEGQLLSGMLAVVTSLIVPPMLNLLSNVTILRSWAQLQVRCQRSNRPPLHVYVESSYCSCKLTAHTMTRPCSRACQSTGHDRCSSPPTAWSRRCSGKCCRTCSSAATAASSPSRLCCAPLLSAST